MKNEIIFFESETERPPHYEDHPACGTPNPPYWCNQSAVNVDMYLPIIILIGFVIGLITLKNKI